MSEVQSRYRTVLKASSLIGGASLINILIGMVKTKFVAVWLGPSGVGLLNLYNSMIAPVSTLAGMGLQTSGVRQIAEAHGSGDKERISKVVKTLRLTCWGTGLLGAFLMVILSPLLSQWTFQNQDHMLPIAFLGSVILFGNISSGQRCIIQGTRRIKALAQLQIIGAASGVLISLPLFYFFGSKGILPSLILMSGSSLLASWIFARKIQLYRAKPNRCEIAKEVKFLLCFGFPLMLTGLQRTLKYYGIRLVLVNRFGAEGVGQWAAALGLSGILVDFVLQAMGTDYYPRLTAVGHDPARMREEVNAQTHVAVILALPALLATMLFAPLAIQIFYSERFDEAIPILRWSIFGAFGRVVTWPLGFIILAKGMGKTYLFTSLLNSAAQLVFLWVLTRYFGLTGSGMAWAATYVSYLLVVMVTAIILIRFRWSRTNTLWIAVSLILLVSAFWMERLPISDWLYLGLSALLVLLVGLISLCELSRMSGWGIHSVLRRLRR
jgi:antigen flippase